MKVSRIAAAACLIVLILSGALCAHDESNKVLEARISQRELEVSRLSGQPVIAPMPGRDIGANWKGLKTGMTKQDVRRFLGEPDDIPMNSYLEVWDYSKTYGGSCSVTFDENGRVESWNAPQ